MDYYYYLLKPESSFTPPPQQSNNLKRKESNIHFRQSYDRKRKFTSLTLSTQKSP